MVAVAFGAGETKVLDVDGMNSWSNSCRFYLSNSQSL